MWLWDFQTGLELETLNQQSLLVDFVDQASADGDSVVSVRFAVANDCISLNGEMSLLPPFEYHKFEKAIQGSILVIGQLSAGTMSLVAHRASL